MRNTTSHNPPHTVSARGTMRTARTPHLRISSRNPRPTIGAATCRNALLILSVIGLILLAGSAVSAQRRTDKRQHKYGRPEPTVIRNQLDEILKNPRFAPRTNFWQWLGRQFGDWDLPELSVPARLAEILLWAVMILCILTLLVIAGHLLYVLAGGLRNLLDCRRAAARKGGPRPRRNLSYQELMELQEKYARQGNFRRAMALSAVALLTLLDSVGAIQFHPGKTNGEYAREYDPSVPGRGAFREFTRTFDNIVYGATGCGQEEYLRLSTAFDRVRNRVHKQS